MIQFKHALYYIWVIENYQIAYDPVNNKIIQVPWHPVLDYDKASKESLRAIFPLIWEADW